MRGRVGTGVLGVLGVLGALKCADAFRGVPASLLRTSLLAPAGAQRCFNLGTVGASCRVREAKQSLQMGGDLPVCVILPGFGNAAVDYSNPFGADFKTSISYALEKRGFEVRVMPLMRSQWFNVLWGLFDLSFWLSKVTPYERSYGWYVKMARDIITEVGAKGTGVIVIGHRLHARGRVSADLTCVLSEPPDGVPGGQRGWMAWTCGAG